MPISHSSIVGGSSAARVLNCPGSIALQASLPQILNRDSFYSIEGTALHTAMELLITGTITLEQLLAVPRMVGTVLITEDLVHDALEPAMAYWNDFLDRVDVWQLETKVQFPGIAGSFGTADVIGRDDRDNITYVTDWKFGAGEPVKAVYDDAITNEQLMFYACGARHTQPQYFPPGCKVVLTVVQPRARGQEPITTTEVSLQDLNNFEVALCAAVLKSKLENSPTQKGRWCRFQACQTICPHHTGALFDLDALTLVEPKAPEYKPTLLDILNVATAVENLIREARSQAHILMSSGEELPGWKLVAKRGVRQWTVDEKELVKQLKLPAAKLYDQKLKSPAGVEKLGIMVPKELTTTVSSGTTIAPVADKRPAISGDPNEISKILLEVLGPEE
jgi:hypothetical protein